MDEIAARLEDVESVPMWDSEKRVVVRVAPDVLAGDTLICVIRNAIGWARQVLVTRASIQVGPGSKLRDKDGREILAFLLTQDDAAACIKAFPARSSEYSVIEKTIGTQSALAGPSAQRLAKMEKAPEKIEVDPKVMLARLERNWFNCGRAAVSIQEVLEDLRAKLRVTMKSFRADDFAEFLSIPGKPTDVPLLIDVTVMGAHTFTIEMQSTDCFYLVQGYQGAYSAFWWQNLAERPQDLALPSDASVAKVEEARVRLAPTRLLRAILGCGRALNLDTLGTELLIPLRQFMRARVWGDTAYDAWTRLPFFTNEDRINLPQPRSGSEPIELNVRLVEVLNWKDLYTTLGATRPASLCGLIVERALALYEQNLKLAKG
jgi:hypothetical protein